MYFSSCLQPKHQWRSILSRAPHFIWCQQLLWGASWAPPETAPARLGAAEHPNLCAQGSPLPILRASNSICRFFCRGPSMLCPACRAGEGLGIFDTESAGVQRQEALCLPMLETHYPAATREHSNNTWKVHVSVHWWDQLMQMAKWLQRASVPSWIQTQFTHSTLSLTTQLL